MAYDLNYINEQTKKLKQQPQTGGVDPLQTPAPPQNTAAPAASAPGPSVVPDTPAYGGGANYNAPGGLQQSFWNTLGVTGGTGQIAPGMLQSKAGELAKLGITPVSGDKVRLPDGTIVDVAGNYNEQSGGLAVWQDPRFNADGSAASAASGGGPVAFGGNVPLVNSQAGGGDFNSQVRQALMAALGGAQGGVSSSDPVIKSQMDAARLQGERQHQQLRKDLAERLYASGGGVQSGQLEQGIQQSRERLAGNLAGLEGNLMAGEQQNRRGMLQNLLQLAVQTGDAENARSLQMALAQMDNELRRATLGEQSRQFDDELGYRLGRSYEDDQRWRLNFGLGS